MRLSLLLFLSGYDMFFLFFDFSPFFFLFSMPDVVHVNSMEISLSANIKKKYIRDISFIRPVPEYGLSARYSEWFRYPACFNKKRIMDYWNMIDGQNGG